MFSGIITDLGRVKAIRAAGDTRFEFSTGLDTAAIDIGASVCCSGVCLTVIDKGVDGGTDGGGNWVATDVSAETMGLTTLSGWTEGTGVNFERALKMGDELGGHMVSGHVDGIAEVVSVTPEGDSRRIVFKAPEELLKMIAPKGSVALDGVSLTVNEVEDGHFGINVIPHTLEMTTLGALKPGGGRVNLEIDMLARYVARLVQPG